MGLDMYLKVHRSTYLPKGKRTIDLDNMKENFDDYFDDEFGCSNSVKIVEQVGYWRKANAIHHWFVKNIQEGVDECQTSDVSKKDIDNLLNLCNNILDKIEGLEFIISDESKSYYERNNEKFTEKFVFHKKNLNDIYSKKRIWNYTISLTEDIGKFIEDNLPPQSGFFFGSTEIDGNYFYDIIKTVLILNRLKEMLNKWEKEGIYAYVTYNASW